MSLETILAEINTLKPFSTENVDEGPIETLNGRRGRKHQAIERIKKLKEDYIRELINGSVFILVAGAQQDAFENALTEKDLGFSSDPEGFYKDLVARIPSELYQGKEGTGSLFDILGRHLEDKAGEMDIVGYPQLIFKQEYQRAIKSREDLLSLVKEAINSQVGGEIAGIHAIRSVVDQALSKNHSGKITPIIFNSKDEKLIIDLSSSLRRLTPNVFVVTVGRVARDIKNLPGAIILKDTTEENIEKALTTIKNSIKK